MMLFAPDSFKELRKKVENCNLDDENVKHDILAQISVALYDYEKLQKENYKWKDRATGMIIAIGVLLYFIIFKL